MRTSLLVAGLALLALGALWLGSLPTAQAAGKEPYVIGAVFDVTGTGAPLGTPERDTVLMLEKQINARGGIDGHPLKVIMADNGSDEAQSVLAVKRLIDQNKVLAIIGPSQTGTTLAASETVETAKVPMISCAAGVKIVEPVKPWIFKTAQSDVHAVAKVLDYLKSKRLTSIAILTVSNAFGDSGKQQLQAQAKGAGISIVAAESFGATDTDMKAQLIRIRSTKAQAIVCWGTNPGPALVAQNAKQLGIKLPLVMSHGIANRKFIDLAGAASEGVIFPAGKLLVRNEVGRGDKQKSVLQDYATSFQKEYNREADTFGGHAYDALMIVVKALDKVGPDRVKLRAEIERMRFVGISGVFNFTATDHNGLAKDAFAMVVIQNGKWSPAKK
jgi:branched-chain amino acid transport system substrate-binding protein